LSFIACSPDILLGQVANFQSTPTPTYAVNGCLVPD
jgi:hypothetical protein